MAHSKEEPMQSNLLLPVGFQSVLDVEVIVFNIKSIDCF